MATTNLDAADLAAVDYQGLINEDVMQTIFDIDPVDLPYQDMSDSMDSDNQYKSWTQDSLEAPQLANAVIDGSDQDLDDTQTGLRRGNHHQESTMGVKVSHRARNVDTIGRADELVYQLMQRQKEFKKRMEATFLSNQASVEDNGDDTAGVTAGCGAMFEAAATVAKGYVANVFNGTPGGFANGIYSAPTPGAAAALTETLIRDGGEAAYTNGGNPTKLMSTPKVIRKLSEYMFTSSARVATLLADQGSGQGAVSSGEYGHQGVTAVGSVTTIVTDFQTLEFCPNRSQLVYDNSGTDCANVYGFDTSYWGVSFLQGIETEHMAKSGLSDKRMMSADYANIAKNAFSSFVIMGIDPTLAVTA